jgi:hypothetical protein
MGYPEWRNGAVSTVLTPELLRDAADRMLADRGRPDIEMHHYRCPKITSNGTKACRCGGSPLEWIFEDELERIEKEKQ